MGNCDSHCLFFLVWGWKPPIVLTVLRNKATKYGINFHIKHNDIRNIDLKIGSDISDKDCGTIYTIKNEESGYYLVK